jgi:hypothetical protein
MPILTQFLQEKIINMNAIVKIKKKVKILENVNNYHLNNKYYIKTIEISIF